MRQPGVDAEQITLEQAVSVEIIVDSVAALTAKMLSGSPTWVTTTGSTAALPRAIPG